MTDISAAALGTMLHPIPAHVNSVPLVRTLTQTDGACPTPVLLCTDDEDLNLLQLQLIHAVAYSLNAKQAPEWVVDAVNEFSYHLKSSKYRTVGSFSVFFQMDFKAGRLGRSRGVRVV
jgi:hypothetical protein